jgi:nitrite reductase/ring-hydroxylating ferredoxin subunit
MFFDALKISDIAPGGMKKVNIEGEEVIICNYEGNFFAVGARCSHMNAFLDTGTLEGYILTCPLHFAQFDITTGEALSAPLPGPGGVEPALVSGHIGAISTYPLRVEGEMIKVDLDISSEV